MALVAIAVGGTASARVHRGTQASASTLSGHIRFVAHTAIQAPLQVLIKNFNVAYPDISVDQSYLPAGASFPNAMMAQINSGNIPDVLYANAGKGGQVPAPTLGAAGKLLDLQGLPFTKRIPAFAHNEFFYGKKIYSAPPIMVPAGMVYNATQFKALGLTVPTTFSQLLQECSKAKANGKSLIAFAGTNGIITMEAMSASIVYSVDPKWDAKRRAGQVTYADSPLWADMLNHLARMRDANCFQPGWQAAQTSDLTHALISGRSLIAIQNANFSGSVAPFTKDSLAVAPFPGDTAAKTRGMIGFNVTFSVSATTKDKPSALAFVNFLNREGQSRLFATLTHAVSLVDAKAGKWPSNLALYAALSKAKKTVPNPDEVGWPTSVTHNDWSTVIGDVLINGKSPSDAMRLLDQDYGK